MIENQVLKIITDRRSIRTYKSDIISEEILIKILEAARWSPSGENIQPWRFVIIRDIAIKEKIGKIAGKGSGKRFSMEFISGEMQKRFEGIKDESVRERVFKKLTSGSVSAFLKDAPIIVAVCGSKTTAPDMPLDCSAAIENMLLAAKSLGIGSCYVIAPVRDVRDDKEVTELLGIPEDFKIISFVSLGLPNENPRRRPRRSLGDIVYFEKWGEKPSQKFIEIIKTMESEIDGQ